MSLSKLLVSTALPRPAGRAGARSGSGASRSFVEAQPSCAARLHFASRAVLAPLDMRADPVPAEPGKSFCGVAVGVMDEEAARDMVDMAQPRKEVTLPDISLASALLAATLLGSMPLSMPSDA